jgi:hypothetical protein
MGQLDHGFEEAHPYGTDEMQVKKGFLTSKKAL